MEIACTLGGEEMPGRLEDWRAVVAAAQSREPIDGGVRLEFCAGAGADVPVAVADLARLAQAEQGCCSFFSFALTIDGRGVGLEVRAPAEAAEVVTGLFGS